MNKLSQVPSFETMMDLIKPVYQCPACKQTVKGKKEIEFLREVGYCADCEHIRGEREEGLYQSFV
uniref:Uncharacterized protein n=1 Tax=viral metagenome TaxID=1070528 RepID=A0A6H2A2V4_9ZZZZ